MLISASPIHAHHSNAISRTSSSAQVRPVPPARPAEEDNADDPAKKADTSAKRALTESELSEDEKKQVRELRERDREVRAHEQAHVAAAGGLVKGGPSFSYKRGPDGKLYAIGGEVQIDTSAVAGDPQASIQKAQRIRRAALAPAQPSAQDRAVAAQAAKMEAEAHRDLATQTQSDSETRSDSVENKGQAAPLAELAAGQENEAGKTSGVCALCGGRHSAEAHSAVNQEKIGKTFLAEQKDSLGKLLNVSA